MQPRSLRSAARGPHIAGFLRTRPAAGARTAAVARFAVAAGDASVARSDNAAISNGSCRRRILDRAAGPQRGRQHRADHCGAAAPDVGRSAAPRSSASTTARTTARSTPCAPRPRPIRWSATCRSPAISATRRRCAPGCAHARGQAVIVMDADFEHPPEADPATGRAMARAASRSWPRSGSDDVDGVALQARDVASLLSRAGRARRRADGARQRRLPAAGPRGRRHHQRLREPGAVPARPGALARLSDRQDQLPARPAAARRQQVFARPHGRARALRHRRPQRAAAARRDLAGARLRGARACCSWSTRS